MSARQPLQVIADQIPNFLKEFLVWCVWMISSTVTEGTTRTNMLPHSPVSMGLLSVANPFQWVAYNRCADALHREGAWSGIGVLLTAEASVVGIELSDAFTEQGALKKWAAEVMQNVPGYWELSPSALGLSGFLRGAMPNDVPKRRALPDGIIEVSTDSRFLPVTGHRLANSTLDVEECPAGVTWLTNFLREPSRHDPARQAEPEHQPAETGHTMPGASGSGEEVWPEPERLDTDLVSVHRFDLDLLPDNFRPYAVDVAERLQVPFDFLGAALLVSLAGVTGRRAHIRPKRWDDWEEAANLWGGIVAELGSMKTPAAKRVMKILHRMEFEAAQQFRDDLARYDRDHGAYALREQARRQQAAARATPGIPDEPFATNLCRENVSTTSKTICPSPR